MSFYDRSMSVLACKGCGERHPIRTRVSYNPYQFTALVERFAQEHRFCERFRNPRKARAALRWMREMRKWNAQERLIKVGTIAQIILARRPESFIKAAA